MVRFWRSLGTVRQALLVVAVAVVAVSILGAVVPKSQAAKDHDAKSKVCTAAVNRVNQKNISDGYPGYTKAEAVEHYSTCMDNPDLDSRGNPTTTAAR